MLIEALQTRTKVPQQTLEALAASASRRYKIYTIPKRDGSPREICHPSKPLKAVQRWLSRNVLRNFPIHPSATAYEKDCSIRHNAEVHAGSKYTVRMDFKDFFPSFTGGDISYYLHHMSKIYNINLTERDIDFCVKIFTRHDRLTIGAPSSPKLTNVMLFDFDSNIARYALENNVIYTRYADDIFISGFNKDAVSLAELHVRGVVSDHRRPLLRLNEEKTRHLSRAGHREVTGLVITPNGKVSLGRERKRQIRTMIYLALVKKLNVSEVERLKGLIAFASDAEPDFIATLSKKFEIDVAARFR